MSTFQYLRDYQTFVGTARYWTESFAKASSLGIEEKVSQYTSFSFTCSFENQHICLFLTKLIIHEEEISEEL